MSNKNLGDWKLPISHRPSVTLECSGGVGYVRWTNSKGSGSEYVSTLQSCFDEKGVFQPHLIAEMVYVGTEMAKAIASDKSPAAAKAARDRATESLPLFAIKPTPRAIGWDFETGIAHFFTYGATSSDSQQGDERRAVRRLLQYLQRDCHIQLWPELDWPKIQRALTAWSKDVKRRFQNRKAADDAQQRSKGAGSLAKNAARTGLPELRTAVRAAQVLVRVAEWLGEHASDSGAARPKVTNVRRAVEKLWQKEFKRNAAPAQPRHTPEEYAKIISALVDRSVPMDPRLRLALLMNAERRAGQVLHVLRSQVTMKESIPFSFEIPARGTKRTPDVCRFDEAAAATLAEAMQTGYLTEFEAAYQAGAIQDYWLFPVGKLAKGRAKFSAEKVTGESWNERSLHDEFKQLELQCGIEPIEGRGHYGLKRAATDISDAIEEDEELKNRFFSHADSKMREGYMQIAPRRLRLAEKDLALQTKMRAAAAAFGKVNAAGVEPKPDSER
jgi:hypothetical protein